MSIFSRTPFTAVPNSAARIDTSSPLGKALKLAFIATGRPGYDAVTGAPGQSTQAKNQVSRRGPALGFGSTHGTASSDAAVTRFGGTSSLRSYFVRFRTDGSGSGSTAGRIFSKSAGATDYEAFYINSASSLRFLKQWGNSGYFDVPIPTHGVWHDAVIVYDHGSTANKPRIWVDGTEQTVSVGQAPTGTVNNTADVFRLGNRASGDRCLDGLVQAFMVWDRLLSAAEVRSLFDNPWRLLEPKPGLLLPSMPAGGAQQLQGQSASHGHQASTVSLQQQHMLASQFADHAHTASTVSFSGLITLVASTATSGQTTVVAGLQQIHGLLATNTLLVQLATNATLNDPVGPPFASITAAADSRRARPTDADARGVAFHSPRHTPRK